MLKVQKLRVRCIQHKFATSMYYSIVIYYYFTLNYLHTKVTSFKNN